MLVRITHLKAPWPLGASVGDVVDLPGVPAWALGKCVPAGDGAVATVFEAEAEAKAPADESKDSGEAVLTGGELPLADLLPAGGLAAVSRDELEAEAKALGVGFNSRTRDDVLAERISEAKAAQ